MRYPQLIFLDAVGTIIHVKTSVGQVYANFAEQFGVQANEEYLNQAFHQVFATAPPPAFGRTNTPFELTQLEKNYWRNLVDESFRLAHPDQPFEQFNQYFDAVFDYFSTAEAWSLYPETLATLNLWHEQGITLGVISNFDSRLCQVLDELNLAHFFDCVTISTQVGAAKPDADIFAAALAPYTAQRQAVYHIGDSWQEDYLGAQSFGIQGIWLNRTEKEWSIQNQAVRSIQQLDHLKWDCDRPLH